VNRVYLYKMMDGKERETGGQVARYRDLAKWSTASSAIAGFVERKLAVGVGDAAREMPVGIVTASFFGFFDAPPAAGRYFTEREDTVPAGTPVAVLSYPMWQTRYAARGDALGSTLEIGSVVYTIIGVAPPHFVGMWPDQPPAAFIPVSSFAASARPTNWWKTYTSAIGFEAMVRRKPGVSVAVATADLTNAFTLSYRAQIGNDPRYLPVEAARPRGLAGPLLVERGSRASSVAKLSLWLAGVTLLVLLIACANVANLLLARALARRREIALCIALGVSRRRLFAQMLTESMLFALFGGAAGLAVAVWMSASLGAMLFPDAARVWSVTDVRTLAFVALIALGVGVVTGLLPMMHARRLSLVNDLKSGARASAFHRSRARTALLVLQGALSVMLLVGAGLLVVSVRHVRDVRLGFDPDAVVLGDLRMRGESSDSAQMIALRDRLMAAAQTVPGVEHVSAQLSVPFWDESSWGLYVAGIDSVDALGRFDVNAVSPDYFAAMGTRLLRGRGIERSDVDGATRVMVVGQSMGAVLWPGQDPIGQCVRVETPTAQCTYVVGIAEDIHSHSLGAEDRYYYYYLAAAQMRPNEGGLFIRATGDTRKFVEPLRRRLQQEMPGASYVTVTPLSEIIASETRSWVMGATLFTAFGVLALVLAAVGLYSVIAYDVAQRRHELAVRLALGAATAGVLRLVVAEGVRVAVIGIAIGGACALAAGRWIGPLLFNESPHDPVVFGVVAVALLAVAVAAGLIPALRASRLDPKAALQSE